MKTLWLIVDILVFLAGIALFFFAARLVEGKLLTATLIILGVLFMVATIVLTMAQLRWWYGQQEAQEQQNGGS